MKDTRQAYDVRIARGCLVSIGMAVLLGTAIGVSSAQEKQGSPQQSNANQAVIEATTADRERTSQPVLQHRNPRYQLCKGDILDLTFPFTPDFNQTVTILPDGFITLKELGDMHVAGKTVPEVTELLKTAYAKILHDPVINIALKDFEKPYFIAGGEIGHPGKYDLRGDTTLTQGIAIAGGFNESSKHSQVLLFRRVSNDWVEVKVLDVKKMFQTANLTEDLHLQPGDMFFVPQNRISKIKKWIPYTSVSASVPPKYLLILRTGSKPEREGTMEELNLSSHYDGRACPHIARPPDGCVSTPAAHGDFLLGHPFRGNSRRRAAAEPIFGGNEDTGQTGACRSCRHG